MELGQALTILGGLWALDVVVYFTFYTGIFSIRTNIRRSWTGVQYTSNRFVTIAAKRYLRVSLEEHRSVPSVFRIVRRHHLVYNATLGLATLLFVLFLILGGYAAFVCWTALGTTANTLPESQAKILIAGHILIFFVTMGNAPFLKFFKDKYTKKYYQIDDDGKLVSVAA